MILKVLAVIVDQYFLNQEAHVCLKRRKELSQSFLSRCKVDIEREHHLPHSLESFAYSCLDVPLHLR